MRDDIFLPHPSPLTLALPHPLALTRAGLSGFPSPAQDYEGRTMDLNERLVKRRHVLHDRATAWNRWASITTTCC